MNEREFFDLLDEAPRTPRTFMFEPRPGERRHVPLTAVAGNVEFRSARHPRTEARAQYLKLLAAVIERDEREENDE